MTGWNRKLGLALTLTALCSTVALAAPAPQDAQALFEDGVALLKRGRDDEALVRFKQVLASEPSHQEAYELFKSTDHEIWLQMLVAEGDMQLVALRLTGLAEIGRVERSNDPDAIRALLGKVLSDDAVDRRGALRQLAAEHGEYAVPYMLPALADQVDEDKRVLAMDALTRMSTDVVLPLIEALASDDAFLRRNVALVLGYIEDPRAAAALSVLAASDSDGGVQQAAIVALGHMGGAVDPLMAYVEAGDDYHFRRANILAGYMYSRVVWNWTGEGLSSTEIPRALYNDELARRAYLRALGVDASFRVARAGVARANVAAMADLDRLEAADEDAGVWADVIRGRILEVHLTGADALDAALRTSILEGDLVVGAALAATLGRVGSEPTPGLAMAIEQGHGELQAEAALAEALLALGSGRTVSDGAVAVLTANAGREVVRIAGVIDTDPARSAEVAAALEQAGAFVHQWGRGVLALTMLRRVPGVDVLVVADSLPDLTTSQIIQELHAIPALAETPVVVLTADTDAAEEIFGDTAAGYATGAEDLGALLEGFGDEVSGDRARAKELAVRSAMLLAHVALAGTDIGASEAALVMNALERDDDVAVPSMEALGHGGSVSSIDALGNIAADADRSDAARSAAAHALAKLFGRGLQPSQATVAQLEGVLGSDAAIEVRSAVAHAIGTLGRGGEILSGMGGTRSGPPAQ